MVLNIARQCYKSTIDEIREAQKISKRISTCENAEKPVLYLSDFFFRRAIV